MNGMYAASLIEQLAVAITEVGNARLVVTYDGFDRDLPGELQFQVVSVSWIEGDDDDESDDGSRVVINVVHGEES